MKWASAPGGGFGWNWSGTTRSSTGSGGTGGYGERPPRATDTAATRVGDESERGRDAQSTEERQHPLCRLLVERPSLAVGWITDESRATPPRALQLACG